MAHQKCVLLALLTLLRPEVTVAQTLARKWRVLQVPQTSFAISTVLPSAGSLSNCLMLCMTEVGCTAANFDPVLNVCNMGHLIDAITLRSKDSGIQVHASYIPPAVPHALMLTSKGLFDWSLDPVVSPPLALNNSWFPTGMVGYSMAEMGGSSGDGHVIICGGGNVYNKTCWKYVVGAVNVPPDPKASLLTGVYYPGATTVKGAPWFTSGLIGSYLYTMTTQLFNFNLGAWENGPSVMEHSWQHCMVPMDTVGDKYLMFGGVPWNSSQIDTSPSPKVYSWRSNTWMELPVPTSGISVRRPACQLVHWPNGTNQIFILGGYNGSLVSNTLNQAIILDIASMTWQEIPNVLPHGIWNGVLLQFGSRLLHLGGKSATSNEMNVYEMDLETGTISFQVNVSLAITTSPATNMVYAAVPYNTMNINV